MKGFGYILAAFAGAALGAFVMYKLTQAPKEEQYETVCTVNDILEKRKETGFTPDELDKEIIENASIAKAYKSSDNDILIIDPDDLGNEYGADSVISLMYYADGILTDDEDNPVSDSAKLIGSIDIPSHWGEYDPDRIAVRNPAMRCDYEILRSERTFTGESTEWEDVK